MRGNKILIMLTLNQSFKMICALSFFGFSWGEMSCFSVSWPCRTCGISSQRRLTEASCRKDGSTTKTPSCAPTNWSQWSLKSGACKHVWNSLYTRSGLKSSSLKNTLSSLSQTFWPMPIGVSAHGQTSDTQPVGHESNQMFHYRPLRYLPCSHPTDCLAPPPFTLTV